MKHKSSTTMQKTWSILNESDSPNSASSTDANYSSPSGGNSSDDSNCSNQTNYSMSTGVMASPPASSGSSSSSSPTSTSSASSVDSPPPLPTHQHQHQQQSQQHQLQQQQSQQPTPPSTVPPTPTATITAAAAAAAATAKENKENPPFNYVTTPQLAETTLQRIKQRYCTPSDNNGNNSESAMRSLELLRMTIQSSFDKDVDVIIRRYIETFFKPAFSNIKENLGDTAVSEEVLQKMSCALLENSKAQYHGMRMRSAQSFFTQPEAAPLPHEPNEPTQVRTGIKRHIAASVSSASTNANTAVSTVTSPPQKRAFSSITTKTQTTTATTAAVSTAVSLPQNTTTERRGVVNSAPLPPSNFQPFRGTALPNQATNATARRQIFWNTANVSTSTKFVLDVQANQAFGFGTDGRERLASKHPELIRYLPDAEDRNWLIAQHIISQHNRNSRFLFLVYDEVCNLMQTHDIYRNKSNINLAVMRTFSVPDFMIEKMRHFFIDLNIKSRGLITTSTSNKNSQQSVTTNSNNSNNSSTASNNTNTNSTTTTTTTTFTGNSSSSSSQLRTALLQGQTSQQPTQLSLFNEDTLMSNASSDYVTTTSTLNDGPNVSNFSAAFQQPARTSALSSTHATLTALLNNSNSPGVPPPLSRVYATAQICTGRGGVTLQVTSSTPATVKSNATAIYVTSSGSNRNNTAQTASSHNARNNAAASATTKNMQSVPNSISMKNVTIVHTTSNGQGKQNGAAAATVTAAAMAASANRNIATSNTQATNSLRTNATTLSITAGSSNNSNNSGRAVSIQAANATKNSLLSSNANNNTSLTRNNTPQSNAANANAGTRNNSLGNSSNATNVVIPIRNPIRNSRATSSRK